MVEMELQSLVNASAMCGGIEKGMKNKKKTGENGTVNFIAEIADELQKERAKNAELLRKISSLEAQIQEKDQQVGCIDKEEGGFKRRKMGSGIESGTDCKAGNEAPNMPPCMDENQEDLLVNWMSTDETDSSCFDKFKGGDIARDREDMDESDDEDEDYEEDDDSNIGNLRSTCEDEGSKGHGLRVSRLQSCSGGSNELTFANTSRLMEENREEGFTLRGEQVPSNRSNAGHKYPADMHPSVEETCQTVVSGKASWNKKPRKVPFCPKEIKKILESDALLSKNAQSHTIRKIIVFSSLGIRHGCEDMFELNFKHFSILRKGEPYVSPKNPGEHVLYENPGIQRKVFYPNRQNPTLCPVQILEEEKAMRPSDPSCPSCLFLCIKYGGRTRNLPQNEYVRQQMGRNKLKSFGPIICRMALLVHIRSGSFFFKALGITLLFMAGFPDNLVQRETKYRNLDLLQKYYRTDRDAEGEELFLSHSAVSDTPLTPKTTSTKAKGKRQKNSNTKSHTLQKAPSSSTQATSQFGLMGYTSVQTHAIAAAFQTAPSQAQADTPQVSNTMTKSLSNSISYHNQTLQTPYHLFSPQPANSFMPMVFWPPPNLFPPGPYPTTYGYRSYPTNANYISIHPQPYYNHPSSGLFPPKITESNDRKNVSASAERGSDSDSSSSSMEEPKEGIR